MKESDEFYFVKGTIWWIGNDHWKSKISWWVDQTYWKKYEHPGICAGGSAPPFGALPDDMVKFFLGSSRKHHQKAFPITGISCHDSKHTTYFSAKLYTFDSDECKSSDIHLNKIKPRLDGQEMKDFDAFLESLSCSVSPLIKRTFDKCF